MLSLVGRMVGKRVPGGPIAVTRLMLGLALGLMSLESAAVLHGLGHGSLTYPYTSWTVAPPSWLSTAVLFAGMLSAVMLVTGLLPQVFAALGSLSCLVVLAADQQTYSNHLLLLTLLLTFLTFAEADRRWGYSTRRHRGDRAAPLWPQLLMMTQVTACYFYAGLSKLQPTFLSGEPLERWMWPEFPSAVFVTLAWLTVITEIGLAVGLWVPRLRVLAVVMGVGLHLSIVVFLSEQRFALLAFALTTMAAYPLFLSRPRLDADSYVSVGGPRPASTPALKI